MTYNSVNPIWKGQAVYIVGGGPSLSKFDWNRLLNKKVIGVNAACKLPRGVCDIIFFGDLKFFEAHEWDMFDCGATVYTNCPQLNSKDVPWINVLRRDVRGLSTAADTLAWNGNSGAAAINLALLLGAAKIYLLGFDMKPMPIEEDNEQKEAHNWHKEYPTIPSKEVYGLFKEQFQYVKRDWTEKFSHVPIINVTDDSALDIFPKVGTKEFWNE
jgi:hypothetical protein